MPRISVVVANRGHILSRAAGFRVAGHDTCGLAWTAFIEGNHLVMHHVETWAYLAEKPPQDGHDLVAPAHNARRVPGAAETAIGREQGTQRFHVVLVHCQRVARHKFAQVRPVFHTPDPLFEIAHRTFQCLFCITKIIPYKEFQLVSAQLLP